MIIAAPILVMVVVVGGVLLVGGLLGYGPKPIDTPPAVTAPHHSEHVAAPATLRQEAP